MSDNNDVEIDPEEQARQDEARRLKEEAIIKEHEDNRARVAFTPAKVKYICSKHAGSILATSEPTLSKLRTSNNYKDLIDKASNIFIQELTNQNRTDERTLPNTVLADLLFNMGFDKNKDALQHIIDKLFIKQDNDTNNDTNNNTNNDININTETVFEMNDGTTSSTTQLASEVHLTEFIDQIQFCDIVTRFEAPSFFYGQRLRRNAGRGQVEEMVELIIRGCNPNTADGEGLTSLHYASEFNRLDVIRSLYDLCGDSLMLNPRDKYGWTPLYCAAHHGNSDVVKLLLELGADPSVSNVQLKTPLHCAASQGRRLICELLISAGASINAQDKHSVTPLHDCNFKGHYDLFEWLINGNSSTQSLSNEDDNEKEQEQVSNAAPIKSQTREVINDILGYTAEDYIGDYKYQKDDIKNVDEMNAESKSKDSHSRERSSKQSERSSKQSERSQRSQQRK